MRCHSTAILVFTIAVSILPSASARAQELSIGYQFQRLDPGYGGVNLPVGVKVDAGVAIGRGFSAIGQYDWSTRGNEFTFATAITAASRFESRVHVQGFGGGIRWTTAGATFAKPFIEAVGGAARVSGSSTVDGLVESASADTNAFFDFGGGATIHAHQRLAVVGQFGYRRIFTGYHDANSIRLIAGVRVALR